jgi:hypothetical protein
MIRLVATLASVLALVGLLVLDGAQPVAHEVTARIAAITPY